MFDLVLGEGREVGVVHGGMERLFKKTTKGE